MCQNNMSIVSAYFLCFISLLFQVAIIKVVAITLPDSTVFKAAPFQNVSWRDDALKYFRHGWSCLSFFVKGIEQHLKQTPLSTCFCIPWWNRKYEQWSVLYGQCCYITGVMNGDDITTCKNTGSIIAETFEFRNLTLEKYHTILLKHASSMWGP